MNILYIDEDGEFVQINGRELEDDELKQIDDGSAAALRFRGNRFEEAQVTAVEIELDEEDEDAGEEDIEFEVEWKAVKVAE